MSGDRERCLAAGMNAFVSKPVRPETLLATIDGLFDGSGGSTVAGAAPRRRRAATPPPAAIDLTTLLAAFGDDRVLLDETIAVFLDDAPAQIETLRRAVAAADAPAIGRAAHALKGAVSLFSLGAPVRRHALARSGGAGRSARSPADAAGCGRAGGVAVNGRVGGAVHSPITTSGIVSWRPHRTAQGNDSRGPSGRLRAARRSPGAPARCWRAPWPPPGRAAPWRSASRRPRRPR